MITRPRFEEALVRAYALTLGQVIEQLEGSFDQELFDRLNDAVSKRNFLAHHFWFWRCHLMSSEAGLSEIHKELSELSSLFHKFLAQRVPHHGITTSNCATRCCFAFGHLPRIKLFVGRYGERSELIASYGICREASRRWP